MTMELGRRLREARLRQGLTQQDVAAGIVSAAFLSMVESGRREPSPEVLAALAARLHLDPSSTADGAGLAGLLALRTAVARAQGLLESGRAAESLSRLRAVEHVLLGLDEPDLRCEFHAWRGRSHEALAQWDPAIRDFTAAAEIAAARGAVTRELESEIDLIRCLRARGDLNAALDRARRLQQRMPAELEGSVLHARLVSTIIGLHLVRGDRATAHLLADRARVAFGTGVDQQAKALVMWNASLAAEANGQPEAALLLAQEGLRLMESGVDDALLARLHTALASLYTRISPPDLAAAEAELAAAAAALGAEPASGDAAALQLETARLHWLTGDYEASLGAAETAGRILGTTSAAAGPAHLLAARACASMLRIEESREHFARARASLERAQPSRDASMAWRELGDAYHELGWADDAMDAYRQALSGAGLPGGPVAAPSTATEASRRD